MKKLLVIALLISATCRGQLISLHPNYSTPCFAGWTFDAGAVCTSGTVHITHSSGANTGLYKTVSLNGDFDIKIDYANLSIPNVYANGVRLIIIDGSSPANYVFVERRYDGGSGRPQSTYYGAGNNAGTTLLDAGTSNTSTSGTFRIKRVGSTITIYGADGTTSIATCTLSATLTSVQVYGWDTGSTGNSGDVTNYVQL